MTVDLEDQIRAYASLLDSAVPDIDTDRISRRPHGRRRVVLLAAAALVLTGVVAAIVLSSDEQGADVITTVTTAPTTTSAPPPESSLPDPDTTDQVPPSEPGDAPVDWDMAVTPPADVFTRECCFTSIDEMADGLLNLDGVTGAEVVGGRIEIDVATVEALARTGRMLVGLGSWVPADAIVLSEEMTEALSVLGEERIAGFTRYVDSVVDTQGPPPRFDTATLGREVPSPVPTGLTSEPLSVTIEGTGVEATLEHPALDRLESDDAVPYLGEHLVFLGVTCRCADPPTSGGGASVEFGPGLEHSDETGLIDGDGEYELVGELTWPGGSAFGIGGLPLTVSVVATELPDGTLLWQRPVSGIALFTSDTSLYSRGAPRMTGYDVDGNVVFVQA